MKKTLCFIFTFVLIFSVITPLTASANLLSVCDCDNGKCSLCHGAKIETCEKCNGNGKIKCDQCEDGKEVCHICNGAGFDSNLDETCRNCNGSGKEQCNNCKGAGFMPCNGCAGTGKHKCHRCDNADGKCLSCKGTGYRDGVNDGVHNVPKKGDTVEMPDGSYIIWGSKVSTDSKPKQSDTDKNDKPKNTSETVTPPEETNEPTETVKPPEETNEPTETEPQGGNKDQSFEVKTDKFNDAEKEKFDALSEDKKDEIYSEVETIVQSVRIGSPVSEDKDLITSVLSSNNADESKVLNLNFEGHISLDFPIAVTVRIDSNIYGAEENIYVYHILQDNQIEFLGEAEKTIKDGKLEQITFYTTGFSNFFTYNKKLIIEETSKETQTAETENKEPEDTANKTIWIIAAIGVAALLLGGLTFGFVKNKRTKK